MEEGEKRVFGILSKKQLGYIPPMSISYQDASGHVSRTSYCFKSVHSRTRTATIDLENSIKALSIPPMEVDPVEQEDQSLQSIDLGLV